MNAPSSCEAKPRKRLFPPQKNLGDERWRNKGVQDVDHLTVNGSIHIGRTIYWCRGKGSDRRVDRWLGIVDHTASVGARELCCRATMAVGFRRAASNLERMGQIRVSAERLRTIAEAEGRQVIAHRDAGMIGPNWTASDCKWGSEGQTCVISGSDGVKVPVVTKSEKRKRRRRYGRKGKGLRIRRRARRYGGADGPYKEFKIVTFYDRTHEHQYAAGTSGDHKRLGRLMRREAAKVRVDQADVKYSVSDGADWIRKQYQSQLPMLEANVLDYYHLAENVAKAARLVYGEGSSEAQQWRKTVLGLVLETGPAAMLVKIHQTLKTVRAAAKREALRQLEQYVAKRCDMLDYPTYKARDFEIGSGPTEAYCKTLTTRLKGSGMRWDLPNAEGLMSLAALNHSDLWQEYWARQRAHAA